MSGLAANAPPPAARKRVLVVDDDEAMVKIVTRVLRDRYDVVSARDGVEGVLRATEQPPPDLILADVMMPRMDGVTMINTIRLNPAMRAIPVIFLTTRGAAQDIISGIQAGARHYLTKPIKIDLLIDKVKKTLQKS